MANEISSVIPVQEQMKKDGIDELGSFITHLDVTMIRILQKFYANGLSFPSDTNCYYVQQLFSELRREGFHIELETLRKRLGSLVKLNLLEKVESYPRIYVPIRDVGKVQKLVKKIQKLLL